MKHLKLSELPTLHNRIDYVGGKHIYGRVNKQGVTEYPHVVRYREYGFYDNNQRFTGNDQYKEPRLYGAPIVGTHLDTPTKDYHAKPFKRIIF